MTIWAVVPVKELDRAKERLASVLSAECRRELMLAMLEDVLAALAATPGLAGLAVATVDQAAGRLAAGYGARLIEEGARDGHTGAVIAAARLIAKEGYSGMLTLPGDIPCVSPEEITQLLAVHRPPPSFTIAPSRDERGSNAILCSPPTAVPLRFGEDSFLPHLRAAAACGITPNVLRLPGVALDVDTPEDLADFALWAPPTRAGAMLAKYDLVKMLDGADAALGD